MPKSLPHQIAANVKWSRRDPKAPDEAPALARAGLEAKFLREADPDGVLDPAERARRAGKIREVYYQRLALASAKARRARSTTSTTSRSTAPPAA